MADDRDDDRAEQDEPSLEMPSLGMPSLSLRRKKGKAEQPAPEPHPEPEPVATRQSAPPPVAPAAPRPGPEPRPEPVRRPARDVVRLPQLPGIAAALVTGAVVGLLAVASVWLSATACEAARGTSSCGGGPGLVILVATVLLLAYLGGWMLRGFGLLEAGSTSFLGLGTAVVVLLAFFSQSFDEVWMVVVAPVVTMAGYTLAWWVTHQLATDD
ncbi:hypothetical protein EXE58_06680 [Nocardioides seonyuensis]|uniref:Uncharacterized protein n=1 Tax=Nocardioides seonyuensis TaxID=2518371 RepID=A0A4P7IDE1_9ACTN|nr:hypothetical protein [Nocardioides seonyuensis]QBX55169.1 hypothetical protein EXE58_06680 [Nocardioides seonyuensis]